MRRRTVLTILLSLTVLGLIAGCGGRGATQEVTFDQLFADPARYNGKQIAIEGFAFHGFEVIVLSERLDYSGYAAGHLAPKGRMMWIEGGIPKEVYDKLGQQQMMGPTERYGKVMMTGKFEYGGKYGHVGGYSAQITPTDVELLSWTPPQQ